MLRKSRPIDEWRGRVAWIGIEPLTSPLHRYPQESQIILNIPDTVSIKDTPDHRAGRHIGNRLPTIEHAREIVRFCQRLDQSKEPYAVVVHCTAGISRSTATASWIRYAFVVPTPELRASDVSDWDPNPTLGRLLAEAAGEIL